MSNAICQKRSLLFGSVQNRTARERECLDGSATVARGIGGDNLTAAQDRLAAIAAFERGE